MEIICNICNKEFELLKNKSYLGAPLNYKNTEEYDPLTSDIIGLCSVCYKIERDKIKDNNNTKEESDGQD